MAPVGVPCANASGAKWRDVPCIITVGDSLRTTGVYRQECVGVGPLQREHASKTILIFDRQGNGRLEGSLPCASLPSSLGYFGNVLTPLR